MREIPTIKTETSIQTPNWALAAYVKSRGIPYRIIPHLLSDRRVEIQFTFAKTSEVERLVEEFTKDMSLQNFLQASRETRDVMMQLVRTVNGNAKPNLPTLRRRT